jgi:DNA-binding MarR family transcriptional regulator
MEAAGLIRRLPDPGDRRVVVVELTSRGQETYRNAVVVQAQKEALFAAALSDREKGQLNDLLRRLMIEFERREGSRPADC